MKSITLTQGETALVSEEDYERVSAHKWCLSYSPSHSPKKYAVCSIDGKTVKMHRFILSVTKNVLINHRNKNKLNNQQRNLHSSTYGQNRANPTNKHILPKYIYTHHQRTSGTMFKAQIRSGKHLTNLGTYQTIEAAAHAYAQAATKLHGEFARTEN
jgi:hypothetical protein